jgi:hypothetical protein
MVTIGWFSTPSEGKQFLIEHLLEQAALDGVRFTDFERRLLDDTALNPAANEDEIEAFDQEHGEEFWERVASLIRSSLAGERAQHGWRSWRRFRKALGLAGKNDDYFAAILGVTGLDKLASIGFRDHFAAIAVGIVVGFGAIALGLFILIHRDSIDQWRTAAGNYTVFGKSLGSLLADYGPAVYLGIFAIAWIWYARFRRSGR